MLPFPAKRLKFKSKYPEYNVEAPLLISIVQLMKIKMKQNCSILLRKVISDKKSSRIPVYE